MAISDRAGRYLGSTKNLAGSVAGLAGLGLHFTGLAAPPQKVILVIDDSAAEAGRLRADLDGLLAKVGRHRLPAAAVERLDVIASMLGDILLRSDVLSVSPEPMFELSRAIRTDLPTSLEGYINLPRWYAPRRGGSASAADELVTQLDLITASLTKTAEAVYDADTRRMRDHTRYLRDREPDDSLGLPPMSE